jgi:hypothetical protein
MCYASNNGLSVIVRVFFRDHDLDKTETNVDKIILVVRATISIKPRRIIEINGVSIDQLINCQWAGREA